MTPYQATILIVEDESKNRRLLEIMLKPEGYRIVTANSGEEALAMVAEKPPDLILLDVMMPGMNGYEVTAKLKANATTRNLPIIILSALDDRGSMLAGLSAGAEDFIAKPIDRAELWVRVRNLLRLKEYSDLLAEQNQLLEQAVRERNEEITERKRAEALIIRLNRLYAILSGINAAIVRIRIRQELFDEACHIAVEYGHFRMAWIGLVDSDGGGLALISWAGVDEGYLDKITSYIKKNGQNSLPFVVRALQEKMPIFCNDFDSDPNVAHWRLDALQRGYRSMGIFPLGGNEGDQPVGLFFLYASEPNFFDREEKKLLTELTANISYALEYIEKEDKLNHLAYHDDLTGLPSRALFNDRLVQALANSYRHGNKLGVLFIDLDNFKNVNDSLGHHAGDMLLKQVAVRFTACMREGDTVARLGGDEFVVILDSIASEDDAWMVSQKILKLMTKPIIIEGRELIVTCSIGIALYPKDGDDVKGLLQSADNALYLAKSKGRDNAQFCTAEMNAKALGRITLENCMRQAVMRQEFLLHYQPRVDLVSGEITGMEALVRWQHPVQGLLYPNTFIPVAEESGLIVPLGEWVLRTACEQNKAWQLAGLKPVNIAVNLSARQFKQQDLVEIVTRILKETELEPAYLELELTENMVMQNVEVAIDTLAQLRAIGVQLVIDDFGIGYSSLNYLKHLPISFFKIDMSFVREITTDRDDAIITKIIISMAHDLGLRVTAEGVETEEQKSFLCLHRCDEMQGYLFSKPIPAEEFEILLKVGRCMTIAKPQLL
ncbi:EAL domain-containing response regulator [Candidatus Nitrotoga sp. M5]|uniref:EAL domain-containing response regulator n=1 Tax=Candidatus Nitrotoga sp. M5 TaxID=2890409 RepID=UPI001EF257F0|nr:EAL domain-containing protein [Candidatus Nitrotoga sp. M5]CAH1385843.1 putative Diguanylate cyclase [Candidatus Nitrotoga sp. M5]